MYTPLFDPSMLFPTILLAGIFLIPSLRIAAWASVLFYLIEKIPQKWLRTTAPFAVALVFIACAFPLTRFFYATFGQNEILMAGPFMGILTQIPLATVIATGVIAPYPLIRKALNLKREWLAIFAAATVAGICLFLSYMIIAFGPHTSIPSELIDASYAQALILLGQFFDAAVIAAAVFGSILFFVHADRLLAGHRRRRGILAAICCTCILVLPAAGTGGLAVFLWQVLHRLHGRLVLICTAVLAVIVFSLAGSAMAGLAGLELVINFTIITIVIIAFAVLIPFLFMAPGIRADWHQVILLAGAVAADLLLSLIAALLRLGERLTPDPMTMVAFACGGIVLSASAYAAGGYLVAHRNPPSSLPGEG
jgi:hypothetical protein